MEGKVDLIEKLCDEVEKVNGFCYLGNKLNASGGYEAEITARVCIGWIRFMEYAELLLGNRLPLKMKRKFIVVAEDQQYHLEVSHCIQKNKS